MPILPFPSPGYFDPAQVVELLEAEGWVFQTDGQRLLIRTPDGAPLDAEIRGVLRAHKAEIISFLVERDRLQALEADRLLVEQGWVVVRCRSLGGARVLWTIDGLPTENLPPEARGLPRFELRELEAIEDCPEALEPVLRAKTALGEAEIVEVRKDGKTE